MTTLTLPGPGATAADLVALADRLGDQAVYNLIRSCRTFQAHDPAGDTMGVLARRLVAAWSPNGTSGELHATAGRLGYESPSDRSNFYKIIDRTGGGDRELLRMAREYGDEATFKFIKLCRSKGRGTPPAEAMTVLARRMVEAEMEHHNVDYDTARQTVAARLDYTPPSGGHSRSNFYRILTGEGRTPDPRRRATR